jgi:archaellum component FlaC
MNNKGRKLFLEAVLIITILVMVISLIQISTAERAGYVYLQIVDKDGNPTPRIFVLYSRPDDPSGLYVCSVGFNGICELWLRSDELNKDFIIREVRDILDNQLIVENNLIRFDSFDQTKTIRILNARLIKIIVKDEEQGYPPISAVIHSGNSIERSYTLRGEIKVAVRDDYEGPLRIGAPLRKSVWVWMTREKNEYSIVLTHAMTFNISLQPENSLKVKISWRDLEPIDVGQKSPLPYSIDFLGITEDGRIIFLDKRPLPILSGSGEHEWLIALPERYAVKAAYSIFIGVYIDYNFQRRIYVWEELKQFFDDPRNSWLYYLVDSRYPSSGSAYVLYLLSAIFSPFIDKHLLEENELLKNQLKIAAEKLEDANSIINKLNSELIQVKKELTSLSEQLEDKKKQLDSVTDKLKEVTQKFDEATNKINQLNIQLEEEKKARVNAEMEVDSLKKQLIQNEQQYKSEKDFLITTIVTLAIIAIVSSGLLVTRYIKRKH